MSEERSRRAGGPTEGAGEGQGEAVAQAEAAVPAERPDPVIELYKQHVDRTLLLENLKLTPEQRLRKMFDLLRFAEELRRAGREARRGT